MCVHAGLLVGVGVCLPVDVCHCLAAQLMFFKSPSVREIKTEHRAACEPLD